MEKNKPGKFIDTSKISLQGSMFETSRELGLEYVLSIDVNRLLAPSFEMHNLTPPQNAVRYEGWERKGADSWYSWAPNKSETFTLAGHSLGHWMSASALLYNATNNKELLQKLNYTVEQLNYLQQTTGTGYIGGVCEDTFIRAFAGIENWADGYWVPWYGIHKIYQGLIDAFLYSDNKTALKVVISFAEWAIDGMNKLSDEQLQSMLEVEYGGMNETFATLYEITDEEKYINAARSFTDDNLLRPLEASQDMLTGKHANTQIPKIIGAAKMYELAPNAYPLYKTAVLNFWDYVVNNRSYAIGGQAIDEHFEANGAESLNAKTCESCGTYNMLRLTEQVFKWHHDSKYMDFYEDALYNHILTSQDPDTGSKAYFISLLQGHHKTYEKKEESWWCCTGTGMENPGRYTRAAYYEEGDSLYINLYMHSTYSWSNKYLTFQIETEYPYSENVKMKILSGTGFATIHFRAPKWIDKPFIINYKGRIYQSDGGDYIAVTGEWKQGDEVDITIPMGIRVYHSRTLGQIVYKYGPITLAQKLDKLSNVQGVVEYTENETTVDSITVDVPYLKTNGCDPKGFVTEIDKSTLTFKISSQYSSGCDDIILTPFYSIHHSFYNVYWDLDSDRGTREKALNSVTIDRVVPDGQQDELGHMLEQIDSKHGSFVIQNQIYYWREAFGSNEAFFSYTMKISGNQKNYLFVRYNGNDTSYKVEKKEYKRDFNIFVDGNLLSNQKLNYEKTGGVYDVFYPIPQKYTDNKSHVKISFVSNGNSSCVGKCLEMRISSNTIEQKIKDDEVRDY